MRVTFIFIVITLTGVVLRSSDKFFSMNVKQHRKWKNLTANNQERTFTASEQGYIYLLLKPVMLGLTISALF